MRRTYDPARTQGYYDAVNAKGWRRLPRRLKKRMHDSEWPDGNRNKYHLAWWWMVGRMTGKVPARP